MKNQDDQDQIDKENRSGSMKSIKELVLGDPLEKSPKTTAMNSFSAIFNGLGIGLLLGILLGLSVSPVVSGVIATISSLLAVLVGLNERFLDPLKSLRIGSFGLFSVVGILLGLYLRANDPFAPSLLDKMEEYQAIGYSDEEARAMITGFIRADSGKVIRQASVLYSGTIEVGDCDLLVYANDQTAPSEVINTFQVAGGIWQEFSENLSKELPEKSQANVLLALRDSFCQDGKNSSMQTDVLKKIVDFKNSDSLKEVETILAKGGSNWRLFVEKITQTIPSNQRFLVYQSISKSISS